jgi:hypothetical protein
MVAKTVSGHCAATESAGRGIQRSKTIKYASITTTIHPLINLDPHLKELLVT